MYNILKEDYVRCVWPNMPLPLGKNGDDLVAFFKDKYNINIQYLEQTKTIPDIDPSGGRINQIFNVYNDSIDKFEKVKQQIGAEYAEDIVRKKEHHYYNERIYLTFLKRFETKLLKEGVLTEADRYKGKLT